MSSPEAGSSSTVAANKPAVTPPVGGATPPKPTVDTRRPLRPALRPLLYLGIPEAVLTWKPKPPSRNTSIFFGVTSTLFALYYYDRRECTRIRQEYIDKVKHLAEEPCAPYEYPRKITVFGAKSLGDDDYDRSIIYFKRYIRPILVGAGIDWEILNGRRHGGLGREIKERIYARRRQLLGLEQWGSQQSTHGGPGPVTDESPDALAAKIGMSLPFSLSPEQQMQRELQGATVLLGRPAYKEYMWAMKQGWGTQLPPQRQDLDEPLAEELADDGKFDEVVDEEAAKTGETLSPSATSSFSQDNRPDEELDEIERRNRLLAASAEEGEGEAIAASSKLSMGLAHQQNAFGQGNRSSRPKAPVPQVDPRLLEPPAAIPAQPPLVFVDYVNLAGWRQIPRRIIGFFNHRERVRAGGEVGVTIALGRKESAREYDAPLDSRTGSIKEDPPQGGDFDWGLEGEVFTPPRFGKLPKTIEEARESYYKEMPRKLKDTRSLARGEREPSTFEKNEPPKSEREMREERITKERLWRAEEEGYEVLRPDAGVAWLEAFRGALRVFDGQAEGRKQHQEGEILTSQ